MANTRELHTAIDYELAWIYSNLAISNDASLCYEMVGMDGKIHDNDEAAYPIFHLRRLLRSG
jgi:hypothetical protein